MTPLEELLSQALLVRDRTVPRDIVPTEPGPAAHLADTPDEERPAHPAAEDLRALCETLVTHTPATAIAGFLTDQLPEPRAALILACVLQLTDTDDGARFWWQYAAGAGQSAAAYCLYLHHLSHGEEDTARWWHSQMDDTPHPAPTPADASGPGERLDAASTTTMLRVLHHLARQTTTRRPSAAVASLMTYMPTAVAVGYLREPDMELPLPGPGFARTVRALLADAAHRADTPAALQSRSRPRRRVRGAPDTETAATQDGQPEHYLQARGETAHR
ncbi:hypothetical protein [Streptomyces sp. NPDC091212]|uniref:hypothetical protein n=1 Tax=Streptomyces sp. NPDC091212 TaxID=3155191 RepID=UPI003417DE72